MNRLGGLWDALVGFDNLWLAWRKTRAGKARRPGVGVFELDLETRLLDLQRELIDGSYRPGRYRLFTIYERKPRVIAAAPLRDRVVHHAVMNLIEAPLDRRFIPDSYACRVGKGVHAAVDRYQRWAQRYAYALKLDIRQYFPSIDHAILKAALRRRIKDRRMLALLDVIIDGSPSTEIPRAADRPNPPLTKGGGEAGGIFRAGIPIGNLTSQFFANLYLDDFDHWVKEQLGVPAYLRYVDDMVLLADDKARLAEWRAAIGERLQAIRLRLHPDKAHITPTAAGINLLGYQVRSRHRRLANHNGYRFRRRLRRFARLYRQGLIDRDAIDASVRAWIGAAGAARVTMSPGPGLAGKGAPNSTTWTPDRRPVTAVTVFGLPHCWPSTCRMSASR